MISSLVNSVCSLMVNVALVTGSASPSSVGNGSVLSNPSRAFVVPSGISHEEAVIFTPGHPSVMVGIKSIPTSVESFFNLFASI